MAQGHAPDYRVKEPAKLRQVAQRLGIAIEGRDDNAVALDVARAPLADCHEKETPVLWAATVVNPERVKVLSDLGIVPRGIDTEISDIMHRTLYGVDADPVNLLLAGLRCAVADLAGCYMGTDLSDILFGIPQAVVTSANIPLIIRHGADWYAGPDHEQSRGTKLFCLVGDVARPGLVEVPLGTPLSAIVHGIGGGGRDGLAVKGLQTGGPSGGCIPADGWWWNCCWPGRRNPGRSARWPPAWGWSVRPFPPKTSCVSSAAAASAPVMPWASTPLPLSSGGPYGGWRSPWTNPR